MSQDEIRRLGFDFYLKDILTGPDDVLNSLCTSNHIYALVYSPLGLLTR